MKNHKNILAILLIVAGFIAFASMAQAEEAAATIHLEDTQLMALIGGDWGHGTLGYDGKIYKFKVKGLTAGGAGYQKVSATGHVYHLNNIADFPGAYGEARAGGAIVKGAGGFVLINDKGVLIKLKTSQKGLAAGLGVEGFVIEMKD